MWEEAKVEHQFEDEMRENRFRWLMPTEDSINAMIRKSSLYQDEGAAMRRGRLSNLDSQQKKKRLSNLD